VDAHDAGGHAYDVGHVFELEGRLLEVTHVDAGEPPFDQRLVCVPVVR
jgi:hypothetical protein